jgi:uncharacterized protein YdgA (DUF945 family)
VKRSFVALLVALAVIVLVSPGIVGRLAEKSMDENLDWAATESEEVIVSSQGFDRGWFSSAGQHRVELRPGELQQLLLALTGAGDSAELPALIIDTRLDHGLIPFSSMSREKGTLLPGLGSAISTVSVELANGETVALPGTIYSDVGLTGELRSRLVLPAGEHDFDGAAAGWGDATIEITTDPASSEIGFDGSLDAVSLAADGEFLDLAGVEFHGKRRRSQFGLSVGDVNIAMQSLRAQNYAGAITSIGPLAIDASSGVRGERVNGRLTVRLDNAPLADFGTANIAADIVLRDGDGLALGNISEALDIMQDGGSSDDFMFVIQDDLRRLLTAGAELRFDRLDISLPQGVVTSRFRFTVSASDPDDFTWTSVLLNLDAALELSLPAELVDLMTTMDPQMHAAIATGVLRKNGDVYEMQAAFQKGLLTVNGAPMPIPIPGLP